MSDRCLRLSLTLQSGQAFRWLETGEHSFSPSHTGAVREWAGVIGHRLYVLRQAEPEPPDGVSDPIWYHVVRDEANEQKEDELVLRDYFRVDYDMTEIVASFCDADPAFNHVFPHYRGVRTLRNHPVECLFSYICSSNNNIKRISGMVAHLASRYGKSVGSYAGREFYSFPTAEVLAKDATAGDLREAGFGYRATYVVSTAQALTKTAHREDTTVEKMLLSWRDLSRTEVAKKLVRFPGIGRKVAGCIALMSLDQLGEIPVDTHVWQIAKRYMPELGAKTLTDRVYDVIGDFFRQRFGEDVAGMAHNVLFVGELADFKGLADAGGVMEALWSGKGKSEDIEAKKELEIAKSASDELVPEIAPSPKKKSKRKITKTKSEASQRAPRKRGRPRRPKTEAQEEPTGV